MASPGGPTTFAVSTPVAIGLGVTSGGLKGVAEGMASTQTLRGWRSPSLRCASASTWCLTAVIRYSLLNRLTVSASRVTRPPQAKPRASPTPW